MKGAAGAHHLSLATRVGGLSVSPETADSSATFLEGKAESLLELQGTRSGALGNAIAANCGHIRLEMHPRF
jgi:hypothetical protein